MMIDLLSISLTEEAGRGAGGPGGRERRGKVETSLDNQNRKFDSYRTRNEKATTKSGMISLISIDFILSHSNWPMKLYPIWVPGVGTYGTTLFRIKAQHYEGC